MLTVTTRYAIDPVAAKAMDTTQLRDNFHVEGMFAAGEIRLTYSHYDRMIVGGAVPGDATLTLDEVGRFYIVSTPAHAIYPTRLVTLDDAASVKMGAPETANDRTIFQFIHPDVMQTCQLVMGYTMFHGGSVWNTMPAHLHDRRMEAYLYFNLDNANRVFHFMGRPEETRHIVMQNEEGVLSPPWSIHCGAGTGRYTFCWAMAGDNVDYKDVEMIAMEDLR